MIARKWTTAIRERKRYPRSSVFREIVAFLLLSWVSNFYLGIGDVSAQRETPEDLKISIAQFDASKYPEITLYLNVTDSSGNNLGDLKEEDFSVTEDGEPVEIIEFAGIGEERLVDIVYIFDTTASMGEEIEGVIQTSIDFANELESKGRDYRLGLVTFGDEIRQVFRSDDALTDDAEEFKGWVGGLFADGGDQDPENDYAAVKRAIDMKFRPDSQKIFILITDAMPHHYGDSPDGGVSFDDPDLDGKVIIDKLNENNISVYAVTPNINEFTLLASETGGRFYDIQNNPDFTGIIEDIGETIANQYRITYHSPRPTYDGTRRDVQVKVGEAKVTTKYAEKHLLNIQSNCLVGLLCLFPLLALWVVPLTVQYLLGRSRGQPASGPPGQPLVEETQEAQMRPLTDTAASEQSTARAQEECPNCGQFNRSGAKFCKACGFKL